MRMVGGRGRIQFKIWKKKTKQQTHTEAFIFCWGFFGDMVENPHWGISYISRPERSKQAVMWQWKKRIRPRATVVSDPTGERSVGDDPPTCVKTRGGLICDRTLTASRLCWRPVLPGVTTIIVSGQYFAAESIYSPVIGFQPITLH